MSSGTLERVERARSRIEVRGAAGHDRPGLLARSVTLNILGQAGSLVVGFVSSVLIARWLGVPKSKVTLAAGQKARLKSVSVAGDPEKLMAKPSYIARSEPRLRRRRAQ